MRYFGKSRLSLFQVTGKGRGKGAVSLLLSTVLFLLIPSFAAAQDEDDQRDSNRGAQYFLGAQDELLIRVNIWGFVRKPGQYMVPKNTDLISLISFAGGPLEQAKIKKVKIIRAVESNPVSPSSNNRFNQDELLLASPALRGNANLNTLSSPAQQVIKVDIKKYIETGQQGLIPELRPGDTIVVPGSTLHFLGKALDFASKFAVIAQIYFWVNVADRR